MVDAAIISPSITRMTMTLQAGILDPVRVEVLTIDGETIYLRSQGEAQWRKASADSAFEVVDHRAYYDALVEASEQVGDVQTGSVRGVKCIIVPLHVDRARFLQLMPAADTGTELFDASGVSAEEVEAASDEAKTIATLWIGTEDHLIYRHLEVTVMRSDAGWSFTERDESDYSGFGEPIRPPIKEPQVPS